MFNWIIGIPFLSLFATVGLALTLITSTRQELGRFTLNVLLVLVALWTFCSFMLHSISFPSTEFWLYLIIVLATCTGAVGVHFCAKFTHHTGRISKRVVGIIYVLIPATVILLITGQVVEGTELLPNGAVEINFTPLANFFWSVSFVMTLTAFAFIVKGLVTSSSDSRRYTVFPLLGFAVMCIGALSNIVFASYPIDIAANFIFIGFLSYGVVAQHQLRPAIRLPWPKTLPVAVPLLALCYAAVVIFCLKWLGITTGASYPIAAITVIIFGSITFDPSRTFLSNKLSQYLFPSIYRYQKPLSSLASVDRSLSRWTSSVTSILNIIAKATGADNVMLLVRDSKTKDFQVQHTVGFDQASLFRLRLPADSPLVKTLAEGRDALRIEDIGRQFNFKVLLRSKDDTLQEIGPILCCGVQGYDGLLAIVALSHKSPNVWNQTEDKDFLKLACGQIAPLIINANLYQESLLEIEERKRMEEALRTSETNYRTVARLSSDFAYSCIHTGNDSYKIDWITDAFYTVSGYSESELREQECLMFISHPDDYEIATEPMHHLKAGEADTREFRIVTKDGQVLNIISYMECQADPQAPGGLRLFGAVQDITERRQAEKALRESEEKFIKVFQMNPQPMTIAVIPEDNVIDVNDSFLRTFDHQRDEVIGKTGVEIGIWVEPEAGTLLRRLALEECKVSNYETTLYSKSGQELFISISMELINIGGQKCLLTVFNDITKRKKMEEALIVTDRLASLGELVSGVAHELNNPLTSVIGFSNLLVDRKNLPDDVKEDLKVINGEALRTATIVKNLLTFARKHQREKQPTDMNRAIEAVLELRTYEQKVNNIQVNTQVAPDLPEITANDFDLRQVFLNIIVNAEHAMLETHGGGTLTITTERDGDIIRASFADDGPGISKENLRHVFDPFFTTKEVGKGTGLGLSICHGVITEHGGKIYAESDLGKGATFVVELPVATTDNEETKNKKSRE